MECWTQFASTVGHHKPSTSMCTCTCVVSKMADAAAYLDGGGVANELGAGYHAHAEAAGSCRLVWVLPQRKLLVCLAHLQRQSSSLDI